MIDWPALILALLMLRRPDGRRVWTVTTLAREAKCSKQRLSELLQKGGGEPKHSLGAALERIHEREIGPCPYLSAKADTIPRKRAMAALA